MLNQIIAGARRPGRYGIGQQVLVRQARESGSDVTEELPVQVQFEVRGCDDGLGGVVVIQGPRGIRYDELPLGAAGDSGGDGHVLQLAERRRTRGRILEVHVEAGIGSIVGLVRQRETAVGGKRREREE